MKISMIQFLIDPNGHSNELNVFGITVLRNGRILKNLTRNELHQDDDVLDGFLINEKSNMLYPIRSSILSLLQLSDLVLQQEIDFFSEILNQVPKNQKVLIQNYLEIINKKTGGLKSGWCQEEMEYYDEAVSTSELRKKMVQDIRSQNLWHIFLERQRHLLNHLAPDELRNSSVLEVGCGNARTLSKLLSPTNYGYEYFGIDVSFNRLLVAKEVIPEGEFIQCSALNLPFKECKFSVALALGALHHLESPLAGLKEICRVTTSDCQILIHEPIEKSKKFLDFSWSRHLKTNLESYEHSEHDNEIDLEEFKSFVGEVGLYEKYKKLSGSVLRTVVSLIYSKVAVFNRSRVAWQGLIKIDDVFNTIFCRRPNSLGPNAVFLLLRKQSTIK